MIWALAEELGARMGPKVAVRTVGIGMADPPLPEEEVGLIKMRPMRRAEFLTGRTAARRAMQALGEPGGAIPRAKNRAPVWPPGIVGSISHDDQDAIAIVGRGRDFLGLGIDLEPAIPLPSDLIPEVVMPGEADGPGWESRAVFAAKETLYKALSPMLTEIWPFTAATIRLDTAGEAFEAEIHRPAGSIPSGAKLRGVLIVRHGRILTSLSLNLL